MDKIENEIKELEQILDLVNEMVAIGEAEVKTSRAIYNEILRLKKSVKGKGLVISKNLIPAVKIGKDDDIWKYSNPITVQKNAYEILGDDAQIYKSMKKDKKYMIWSPNEDKWIYFGAMGYEDYTKHNDWDRRRRYRARAENIKGDWLMNEYSPNNLSIHLLW